MHGEQEEEHRGNQHVPDAKVSSNPVYNIDQSWHIVEKKKQDVHSAVEQEKDMQSCVDDVECQQVAERYRVRDENVEGD